MLKTLKQENLALKKEIKKLEKLVWLDFLTKVYNRRAFNNFFKDVCQETDWSKQHQQRRKHLIQFSLLLIDLDDFKKYNDKFSHLAGDKVLIKTAKLLKNSVRGIDVVARWGGEEFAIILKETNGLQAKHKAESLIKQARKNLPVTFSIGLVESNPNFSFNQIFAKADKALYLAKKKGKNQIVISD